MCFGGGSVQSGPQMGIVNGRWVEQGVPPEFVDRGATTVAQYQQLASQDLSDKQLTAQREIANQQNTLNEQQFAAQQEQVRQQQNQVEQQASRQSQYDSQRAQLLGEGTNQVSQAFGRFSPEYFQGYARDYMAKAQDQIGYQQRQAQKDLAFQLARQGISASQAGVNQQGLIGETAGRATAEQTAQAQNQADALRASVAGAKNNLLNQVTAAQSIGSPIAGGSPEDINAAVQTQRNAISGVTSSAGDVAASLQAVPQVSTLGNIFSGVLGAGGSLLGGIQQNTIGSAVRSGFAGTNPRGSGSTTNKVFG